MKLRESTWEAPIYVRGTFRGLPEVADDSQVRPSCVEIVDLRLDSSFLPKPDQAKQKTRGKVPMKRLRT